MYMHAFLIGLNVSLVEHQYDRSCIQLEDVSYNDVFDRYSHINTMQDLFNQVPIPYVQRYIDIQPYLDDFLRQHLNDQFLNVFSLSLSGEGKLIIYDKWVCMIKKRKKL